VIPCAYLRVFRPLETYSEDERARWERYILSGGPPRSIRPVYRDERAVKESTIGLLAPADGEFADIRLVEGQYYVCPWRMRLRVLAGILSLRESAPPDMAETFVPEAEARRAARELAKIKRREPAATPALLQSPWHVPIRWFVLVSEEERHLVQTAEGGWRLYYWTPITLAKRRAERALQVLRRTDLAPIAQPVRELAQWLSAFHPRSMVELDYGSVSELFSWDELDNDHSAGEIAEAVEALTQPSGMARAAELYQSVANRWAEAKNRESMN
jgi:hypothetical protein